MERSITIDYASLSPEDRDTGSMLLGGSTEFYDGDSENPHEILEGLHSERLSDAAVVVAIIRWGDRNAPQILEAMDNATPEVDRQIYLPYVVTFVIGRVVAQFNEAPGLSAERILEIEEELLEDREREALQEWGRMEFSSTLEREMAYRAMPMRALILPWEEEIAEDLLLKNQLGILGSDRRFCLGIVGKRVFNEEISMNLETQPDK